ncbi:MAG: YdcF family protein [Rickettsiales bacterium]
MGLISVFALWSIGLGWFSAQIPYDDVNLSTDNSKIIVVFTGDSGRLEYALNLLAEEKGKILFISGVGKRATINDIMRYTPKEINKKIDKSLIYIGYEAEDTIGNAIETANWLHKKWHDDKNKKLNRKEIILVTSNYHMPRSLFELSKAMPDVNLIPAPVINKSYLPIISEYNKYIASNIKHLMNKN